MSLHISKQNWVSLRNFKSSSGVGIMSRRVFFTISDAKKSITFSCNLLTSSHFPSTLTFSRRSLLWEELVFSKLVNSWKEFKIQLVDIKLGTLLKQRKQVHNREVIKIITPDDCFCERSLSLRNCSIVSSYTQYCELNVELTFANVAVHGSTTTSVRMFKIHFDGTGAKCPCTFSCFYEKSWSFWNW